MSTYLQTFISGLQDLIADVLRGHGANDIRQMLDGAVVYQSGQPVRAGCFNNTFEVLMERPYAGGNALDRLMADALHAGAALPLRPLKGKARTFRIVSSIENKLSSVNAKHKSALEQLIAHRTGLSADRSRADVEFWLYARSEGRSYLMRRLSYDRVTEKQLQKGELRPELCWCMNYLSRPAPDDVFLDPFAGSGAIPLSRTQFCPWAHLYALDIDQDKVSALSRRLGPSPSVTASALDVRRLADLVRPGSVTKIVTDPPWGFYDDADIPALYRDMWDALLGVIHPSARLVILSARTDEMDRELQTRPEIQLDALYRVLVNGKKAGLYSLSRKPERIE